MSARRHLSTGLVALVLAAVGFAGGASWSAISARDARAKPWRKMRVEHEGLDGVTTRTRVIFDNSKMPLTGVEVVRNPEGAAEIAHVEGRNGEEITARYDKDGRPRSLEGPDGAQALLSYKGTKARVTFVAADGKRVGSKVLRVPVQLRSALKLAQRPDSDGNAAAVAAFRELASLDYDGWSLVGEAAAQEAKMTEEDKADEKVNVKREVQLRLDVRMAKSKGASPGTAQIEASCPPYACLPVTKEAPMPGESSVWVAVNGSAKRGALKAPPSPDALDRFKKEARKERATANRVLKEVAKVVAAVGVTASACRSLKLSWPICVSGLSKKAAGAAVHSVSSHQVKTKGRALEERAVALHYREQARAKLDRAVKIEVCVSRDGYTRSCVKLDGRPFGRKPMAAEKRTVELRRGLSGALAGAFDLKQYDGDDCKFSPSPKTSGKLSMSFDEKRGVMTATLKANERGTRPGLRCSLGTADMRWSQSYNATATQSFTAAQIQAGGKLSLRMVGTMSGAGNYSWSNCRSSGGANVSCPAGRGDSYSYPIKILGELDLDSQKGSGQIVVNDAPLSTKGSWRVPAGGKR